MLKFQIRKFSSSNHMNHEQYIVDDVDNMKNVPKPDRTLQNEEPIPRIHLPQSEFEIENSNCKLIKNLTSKVKILEYKMAILEPQYPISGRKPSHQSNYFGQVRELFRRSLLLTSGHGRLLRQTQSFRILNFRC